MGGGAIKAVAEANFQDLGRAINFATMSFQERQTLFRESIKNEDYPLAFQAFIRSQDASYSIECDLQNLIKSSGGFLALLGFAKRDHLLEPEFLADKFSLENPNSEEGIKFFTKIFSVIRSELKRQETMPDVREETLQRLESDKKDFCEKEAVFIENLTKILVANHDVKTMALFYKLSDVDCRDQIELSLARNIETPETAANAHSEEEQNILRKDEFLNAMVMMESLIPSALVESPSAKIGPKKDPLER